MLPVANDEKESLAAAVNGQVMSDCDHHVDALEARFWDQKS